MDPIPDQHLARIREGIRLLALRRLGDPELADDVAQETVTRGLVAIRQGRPADVDRMGAYFRGIALNVIADHYRESGRAQVVSHEGSPGPDLKAPSPLDAAIRSQRAGRVRRALAALAESDRELLRLTYYEGLTSAEIARRNHEPPARIRKRKQRALERLADVLDEQTCHTPTGRSTEGTAGPAPEATPEERK